LSLSWCLPWPAEGFPFLDSCSLLATSPSLTQNLGVFSSLHLFSQKLAWSWVGENPQYVIVEWFNEWQSTLCCFSVLGPEICSSEMLPERWWLFQNIPSE
jgi:hypothetical protein